MNINPHRWTSERVEQLTALCAEGLSASQIMRALGVGVTRNAVIGKIHRLGLTLARRVGSPRKFNAAVPRLARAVEFPPTPTEEEPAIGPLCDVAAAGACKFIAGDVGAVDWRMCGHPAKTGSVYCAHHHARCYSPANTEKARKRAADAEAGVHQNRRIYKSRTFIGSRHREDYA